MLLLTHESPSRRRRLSAVQTCHFINCALHWFAVGQIRHKAVDRILTVLKSVQMADFLSEILQVLLDNGLVFGVCGSSEEIKGLNLI